MSKPDPKTRILDAAEHLFAERGYHGATMRQVADASGASLSLTQYHFKTKEALFGAVMERCILSINHQRLLRLGVLETTAIQSEQRVSVDDVLRAFLEPTVLLARDTREGGQNYAQLIAHIINDPQPHARAVSQKLTDPIARQTMRMLGLALPGLDEATLAWCYIFMVGAMVTAISPTGRIELLSNRQADGDDVERILALLVPFLTAGFERIAEQAGTPLYGLAEK